jgi:hypothetical protein
MKMSSSTGESDAYARTVLRKSEPNSYEKKNNNDGYKKDPSPERRHEPMLPASRRYAKATPPMALIQAKK